MSADLNENLIAWPVQDPNPRQRLQIGSCEYKDCGRPAYYEIDFDCDDITASLCDKHHTAILKHLSKKRIPGLLNCEDDE